MTDKTKDLALEALDKARQVDDLTQSDKADADALARFLQRQWSKSGNSAEDFAIVRAIVERRTK